MALRWLKAMVRLKLFVTRVMLLPQSFQLMKRPTQVFLLQDLVSVASTQISQHVLTACPAKRKRPYDESSAMGHDSKSTGIAAMQALIGDMLEAKLTAHERRVGAMLSAHEDKVQEMLTAHLCKVNEQLAINNYSIADQIDAVEERVRNDVVSEFTDTINNRILEEMEGVQESVMEQITSMPLQAHLTFPNHPYL